MLTAAHELRNQLGIIKGWSDLGTRRRKPSEQCFQIIEKAADTCEQIIREMLARNAAVVEKAQGEAAAKMQAQEPGVPIDLNSIAETTRQSIIGLYREVMVKMDLAEHLPSPGIGQPGLLFRAVYNLALNAGAAGAKRITLRTRALAGCVWLTVADDGSGMTQRKLREILSPEYTPTHEHGRGVSIVRSCVAGMGGELLGESTLGRGSTFTILFNPQAAS